MDAATQFFRAGAGAVIIDGSGLVLALERAGSPGAWQLPQGGLEAGEEPLAAALREAAEETGIPIGELHLLDAYPEPLAYELPPPFRSDKTGRGQVLYWFLFRFTGSHEAIAVEGGGEFRAWQWMPFAGLLSRVAAFRLPVYRQLADRFRPHLASSEPGGQANFR